MNPLWVAGQESLTRGLVWQEPLQDQELEYRYDLSNIAELQDDRAELVDVGLKALQAGSITINEFRTKYLEDEAVADGDVYMRTLNLVLETSSNKLWKGTPVEREVDSLEVGSEEAQDE